MSLYGALFSGVSGLKAQSNKIGVISDNISNTNTVGYKGGSGQFQTLVTTASGAAAYSPGGVLGGNRQLISKQGLLQSTDSPTDIAISGSGFFVVNQLADGTGSVLYTRAGSFTQDATGNYRNNGGFFLQAWPLDREGRLPGAVGNANTVSSANLSSLTTVNVQNLTGTAAATTAVSVGANLDAGQTAFAGASGIITMTALHAVNNNIKANDIILPGGGNSIAAGDAITVTSGLGDVNARFEYGGYTYSRVVTTGAAGDDGVAALGNGAGTLGETTALAGGEFTTGAASDPLVTVTLANHNLRAGDYVTISGVGTVDGVDCDGTFMVTSVATGSFVIDTGDTTGTGTTGAGGAAGTLVSEPIAVANSSSVVQIRHEAHGLATGAVIALSDMPALTGTGYSAGELDGSYVITVLDANHYTITVEDDATASIGGGGVGAVDFDTRPYAGQILDAQTATQLFLGTTGTSGFTAAGLTFTITTPTAGTTTFTYTASTPNAQLHQFNNMTNLAAAISAVDGLTARVDTSSNRLYISATNATEAMTFANGSIIGDDGPPVQAGIDWIGELGIDQIAQQDNRFSTLTGLAALVNATDGLDATVTNPLGDTTVTINLSNPLDSMTIADDLVTGSLLSELGLNPNAGTFTTAQTTGVLEASYDPNDSDRNMASGAITAQFSRTIQVFDGLGTAHTLTMGFLKTGNNAWAVEIYAVPATDVDTNDGIIAAGTINFNGDGTLLSVESELTDDINVNWQNGSDPTTLSFDFGTAGGPGTGLTDGLGQFDSSYRVNFVDQNGAPVGDLTGVAIDEDGFIVASYSNGETQRLYKIPLAAFPNPDQLRGISGNVFAQTSESGEVNLTEAGTNGVGKIASASLEASNVELADQLTDMIVAQRAYQANTKIISTADSLLEELNRILQ